jgi:hypothetical protein
VTLCRPLSYGRRAEPSKQDGGTLERGTDACSTLAQDHAVTSDQWDASPLLPSVLRSHPAIMMPSQALQRHPRRCWVTGRQDAATPAAVRPTASRQLHPRVSIRTMTKRGISIPPPSKPLLGGYRARHDAPPEARFARTAVHSVALSAMPSHVARKVRHACKLPPPWPIKGGAVPWPQGDDRSTHTRTLTTFITILALASIKNL